MTRISFNIGILISILFLPWWCSLFVGIIALFFVSRMFELIVWGTIFDLVFGSHLESLPTKGLLIGLGLCALSFFVNKRVLIRK